MVAQQTLLTGRQLRYPLNLRPKPGIIHSYYYNYQEATIWVNMVRQLAANVKSRE